MKNLNAGIETLTTRLRELWAEYQTIRKQKNKDAIRNNIKKDAEKAAKKVAAERAAAEFNPHPRAIAALMSKITAYNEGKNVKFSPSEMATIEAAANAAEKFLIFVQPLSEAMKTAIQNLANNAKIIAQATKKILEEERKQLEATQAIAREKNQAAQKQRVDSAKKQLNEAKLKHADVMAIYDKELAEYNKAQKKYDALSDEEKKKQPKPTAPKNPDETLLDGVTLTDIYSELEKRMTDIHSSKVNEIGKRWYCGPSAVSNVVMNNNPEGYVTAVIDLATKGEGKFSPDSKKIKLPKHLKNATNEKLLAWAGVASTVDLVFGGSIRHKSNGPIKRIFKKAALKTYPEKDKGSLFGLNKSAVYEGTFPSQTAKMLKMCGLKIDEKKIKRGRSIKDLKTIEAAVASGLTPIILDNYLIKYGKATKLSKISQKKGLHYMPIYEFKFFMDNGVEKISIKYWDYGSITGPINRTVEEVVDGMKGYWIPEMVESKK